MIRRIVSAVGLGVLGIDPITALYILSMGLRREKKANITCFMASFVFFSIVPGAILSVLLGTKAVDLLTSLLPEDGSPFWAYFEFAVSVVILIWVIGRLVKKDGKQEEKAGIVDGTALKYIATGFGFAIAAYTDPTYYAAMLLGGETGHLLPALLLLALWLLVSQCPAMVVYGAVELNCLHKLVEVVDRIKASSWMRRLKIVFYLLLIVIAGLLILDSGWYLFRGSYLF